jgi:hypothetical protein
MSVLTSFAHAQNLNKNWQKDLNAALAEFKSCNNTPINGINPCNKFLGESLKKVYNINDFYNSQKGRYMLVEEMSDYLASNSQWTELGGIFDQEVLNKAQANANDGKAVVALFIDSDGLGHMSLILPGKMHTSATWSLKVPNSSSFFTAKPEDAYVNKGLSYAFNKSQAVRVKLFSR